MFFSRLSIIILALVNICLGQSSSKQFVHPGITHKLSDLDRMKYMVAAKTDPWFATYNEMKKQRYSSYDYSVGGDSKNTTLENLRKFENDGNAAYHNALMWYITEDERHAKKCVEIFNAWKNITRIENQFALSNGGALWRMLEAAEIIKHTHDGWSEADIEQFGAMLVYPGWSGTEVPKEAIVNKNSTFYWNIYQGDRARHGNQGLFAYRSLMAMGIFLDNEVIYQRALRYLQGLPHRPDDLSYPHGPPITEPVDTGNRFYEEFKITGWGDKEDYGYNEVMSNYIYENGQCQESSRDQAHAIGGLSIISCMSEIAWSQGDDLYGHLNNRPLLGLEFYFRYNLSLKNPYPDQKEPWEPTVKSGEYIERIDRSGRWKSLQVNPFVAAHIEPENYERGKFNLIPIYEMNLAHYRDRLALTEPAYKWLQRGFDKLTEKIGFENGDEPGNHPGWGGLKFRRVSPGDPISNILQDVPVFGIPTIPATIEAENYDYFPTSGQGRTYQDATKKNVSKAYREDDVDIWAKPGGGYAVNRMDKGEWLTYTIHVPETANYDLSVIYLARKVGSIQLEIQDHVNEKKLPLTTDNKWTEHDVKKGVPLKQGVHKMKVTVTGPSGAYVLDSIRLKKSE